MTSLLSSPTVLPKREWWENLSRTGEWLMLCVGNITCNHAEHEMEREVGGIPNMQGSQLLPALGNGCQGGFKFPMSFHG